MTRLFVICSAAASCQTAKLTDPCDVLVAINPKPETNSYLVASDRAVAVAIAQHRGRYQLYQCGAAAK